MSTLTNDLPMICLLFDVYNRNDAYSKHKSRFERVLFGCSCEVELMYTVKHHICCFDSVFVVEPIHLQAISNILSIQRATQYRIAIDK